MNREQQVERLQTLLERVQVRAKQARPPRAAVVVDEALRQAPEAGPRFASKPVAMPTADPFDVEETRPFATMPAKVQEQAGAPAILSTPDTHEPPPLDELDEIMLEPEEEDDVSSGGLEIVGDTSAAAEALLGDAGAGDAGLVDDAEDVEPPASSRRIVAEPVVGQELDLPMSEDGEAPRETPPPESGPQAVVAVRDVDGIEVDFERMASVVPRTVVGAPRSPSVEMVGQTVELEEGPVEDTGELELDEAPVPAAVRPPSTEMEAVIPGASAPGRYPPEAEAAPITAKASPFPDEPPTGEWDLPTQDEGAALRREGDEVESLPLEEGEPEARRVEEPATVQKGDTMPPAKEALEEIASAPAREEIAAVTMVAEAGAADAEAAVLEVRPITVEVAGAVIKGPVITADDIARFVGAVESFEADTFVGLLDASLSLGGE